MCTPKPRWVPAHCRQRKTAKLAAVSLARGHKQRPAHLSEAHWGFGFPQSMHVLFSRPSRRRSSFSSFRAAMGEPDPRVWQSHALMLVAVRSLLFLPLAAPSCSPLCPMIQQTNRPPRRPPPTSPAHPDPASDAPERWSKTLGNKFVSPPPPPRPVDFLRPTGSTPWRLSSIPSGPGCVASVTRFFRLLSAIFASVKLFRPGSPPLGSCRRRKNGGQVSRRLSCRRRVSCLGRPDRLFIQSPPQRD
jgi:hypothetical protein